LEIVKVTTLLEVSLLNNKQFKNNLGESIGAG